MLEIVALSKKRRGLEVLRGLSLEVPQGVVCGLVGDNGAGKSTFLECLTGVLEEDSGKIVFCGERLAPGDVAQRRTLGIEMIYQDLRLCLQQDVASNIFLGAEPLWDMGGFPFSFIDHKKMHSEAQAFLNNFGASFPSHALVGSLSGGQRQAVAFARALARKPKMLILDEPTAALGVKESHKVMQRIEQLKNQGISLIFVSHRLGEIFQVADRIAVLQEGKISSSFSRNEISEVELHELLLQERHSET